MGRAASRLAPRPCGEYEKAAGNRAIDPAFHQIIGDVDAGSLRAMNELAGEGIAFQ
jgi:hypothetical protein